MAVSVNDLLPVIDAESREVALLDQFKEFKFDDRVLAAVTFETHVKSVVRNVVVDEPLCRFGTAHSIPTGNDEDLVVLAEQSDDLDDHVVNSVFPDPVPLERPTVAVYSDRTVNVNEASVRKVGVAGMLRLEVTLPHVPDGLGADLTITLEVVLDAGPGRDVGEIVTDKLGVEIRCDDFQILDRPRTQVGVIIEHVESPSESATGEIILRHRDDVLLDALAPVRTEQAHPQVISVYPDDGLVGALDEVATEECFSGSGERPCVVNRECRCHSIDSVLLVCGLVKRNLRLRARRCQLLTTRRLHPTAPNESHSEATRMV